MGRLHLVAGTRYLRNGHVYVVRQLLLDGRVLVENQSVGGQTVLGRDDLGALWGGGALTFEAHDPRGRAHTDRPLPTAYTMADFHLLPEAHRAEAWRRYTLIRPLLALPPRERTRPAIERYLADDRLHHTSAAGADSAPPMSRASVERYVRAFEQSGYRNLSENPRL